MPDNEKRAYPVKVNFDIQSYNKLRLRSRRTGKSMSEIVFDLAVNGYVKEPLSQEVIDCLRDLAGMANNLNQAAKMGHTFGYHHISADNERLAKEISHLIIKLNETI